MASSPRSKARRPAPAPKRSIVSVRAVDPKEHIFSLTRMQRECFPKDAFMRPDAGHWVMAFVNQIHPIGFALLVPEPEGTAASVERVGVMPAHRGHRLQVRLLSRCEALARKLKVAQLIATTYDNPAAVNNFIYAGWQVREPEEHYAGTGSVYWFKDVC